MTIYRFKIVLNYYYYQLKYNIKDVEIRITNNKYLEKNKNVVCVLYRLEAFSPHIGML